MVFCPVVAVVILESRVAICAHGVEEVAPDDVRKDAQNMLRNN
jgi:hypothetical protein